MFLSPKTKSTALFLTIFKYNSKIDKVSGKNSGKLQ